MAGSSRGCCCWGGGTAGCALKGVVFCSSEKEGKFWKAVNGVVVSGFGATATPRPRDDDGDACGGGGGRGADGGLSDSDEGKDEKLGNLVWDEEEDCCRCLPEPLLEGSLAVLLGSLEVLLGRRPVLGRLRGDSWRDEVDDGEGFLARGSGLPLEEEPRDPGSCADVLGRVALWG